MSSTLALKRIRSSWLARIAHRLARGEGIRSSFETQLNRFYDLLLQAVETGDPAWVNAILDDWVAAGTQSELEERQSTAMELLNAILLITFEIARDNLDAEEALETTGALLPIFTHALSYTSHQEANHYIEHISGELDTVRTTMERLDKSKSDFIAIAAHELKTPLTLIEGYAAMLADSVQEAENARGEQLDILLNGIDKGTGRLREIVDDMIDVSMIDNNLLALNFQPVWLQQLFGMLRNDFIDAIQERSLELEINEFPGHREMIFADPERLLQAFRNIVSNAIKYTPDRGKITVDGRMLPGFIEVTVGDTGIGINPEYHQVIFEKFGQLGNVSLHSTGKTKYMGGGPGLGLSITKGIIEAHGGAIWVESEGYDAERYPGSTFHILIPVRKEPPDERIARLFRVSEETSGISTP